MKELSYYEWICNHLNLVLNIADFLFFTVMVFSYLQLLYVYIPTSCTDAQQRNVIVIEQTVTSFKDHTDE